MLGSDVPDLASDGVVKLNSGPSHQREDQLSNRHAESTQSVYETRTRMNRMPSAIGMSSNTTSLRMRERGSQS